MTGKLSSRRRWEGQERGEPSARAWFSRYLPGPVESLDQVLLETGLSRPPRIVLIERTVTAEVRQFQPPDPGQGEEYLPEGHEVMTPDEVEVEPADPRRRCKQACHAPGGHGMRARANWKGCSIGRNKAIGRRT